MANLITTKLFVLLISFITNANSTIYSSHTNIFKNDVLELDITTSDWDTAIHDHDGGVGRGSLSDDDDDDAAILHESFQKRKETNARQRRAVDTESHRSPISTTFDLKDHHTNALISWAGRTPDVIALTKTPAGPRSNLSISRDYGRTFTNIVTSGISCLCVSVAGVTRNASLDYLYHASAAQNTERSATSYIFTDKINQIIVYTRDLQTFTTVHVDFQPSALLFHPVREDVVIAYGSAGFASINNLYISTNFGSRWNILKSNVKKFQWGWNYNEMFVSVPRYFGFASGYDLKVLTYDDGIQERTLRYGIQGFEQRGSFLFVTQLSSRSNTSSGLDLYVSKNGSEFRHARFPVIANYTNREYYIVDADEDRVMIIVVHEAKSAHLYVSDNTGTQYTLSLPNIVYMSTTSTGGTALPGLEYYKVPVADIHKVEGLRGIYIASQFLTNKSIDTALADVNQTTRITYDKGGEWTHISAPYRDMSNSHTHCYWFTGCTLHLLQDFIFGNSYRAAPVLSSPNAVGIVMGAGVLGYTLKQETNPSIFLSTDAGFTWKEVARGNYSYNFGDHGNLIVMVPLRNTTKTVLYSHNEGETWSEYQFISQPIKVYGVLTEPGSKSANFSLWGSNPGGHSWIVVHLNLRTIFGSAQCPSTAYKNWYPGVGVSYNEICLLGEQEVIERKKPEVFCYNGKDYERPRFSKICKCVRADYECDYGYIKVNQSENLWNPRPTFYSDLSDIPCERDSDVTDITTSKPNFCPYGTSYNVTRGFRKIPGDVCEGGVNHQYDKMERNCPADNKTDFILYSSGVNIYRFDLNTQQREFLVRGSVVSEIYSVEFDYNKDIIYWADRDTDSVKFFNVSDAFPTPQTLISGNTGKIECISLDWESDNIYMVDSRTPKIEVFTTVTHWRRILVQNNDTATILENPRALEVFPLHGLMFWTDWSSTNPRVMKATMSGLNPTTVISNNNSNLALTWPNGLAVDIRKEKIYVADGSTHRIIMCNFDGTGIKVALNNSYMLQHPFAMTLRGNRLYWSDWQDKKIKSVFTETFDGYYTVLTSYGSRIMSVKGMDWDKQYRAGNTGCGRQNETNGGCSNLCIPQQHPNATTSTNRVCMCSEDTKPSSVFNGSSEHCSCSIPGETFNTVSGRCRRPPNGTCASGMFACATQNSCIPMAWQCDRESDCSDHSDERNCESQLCESDEFLCKVNQKCIRKDWLCDGDRDCSDGADEGPEYCNATRTCPDGQFQCSNNSRCIQLSYKCDGSYDCGLEDNSDEIGCATRSPQSCGSGQFHCNSTSFGLSCIPQSWLCDHAFDCDDHSDEFGCGAVICADYEFKCVNSSRCIPNGWICDHDFDCDDNSDEASCPSTTYPSVTTTGTLPTSDCICYSSGGRCVPSRLQCDLHRDCPDGRDEWGCSYNTTTTAAPCYGFTCGGGQCLRLSQVCDNHNDCYPSNEDEQNCNKTSSCGANQIRCAFNAHQCINPSQRCDGTEDCIFGTDEQDCVTAEPPTGTTCPGRFQCISNGFCLDLTVRCDGRWDCDDGTDEQNCNMNVTITQFRRTGKGATFATFTWSTDRAPGSDVTYIVQYMYVDDIHSHQHGEEWINGTVTSQKQGNVSGLEPYANYKFIVRSLVMSKNGQSLGQPSQTLMLSTNEAVPGPVNNVRVEVDLVAEEPGYWILSWNYPVHPNGRITIYDYEITDNFDHTQRGQVDANGPKAVSLNVYVRTRAASQMGIKVWATNGAGKGAVAEVTHCLQLVAPSVNCQLSTVTSVSVEVQTNQDLRSGTGRKDYRLRMSYVDLEGIPHKNITHVYDTAKSYILTAKELGSGMPYDITVEVEQWPIGSSHHDDDEPTCISSVRRVTCRTAGDCVGTVNDLIIGSNTTKTSINMTWNRIPGATQYKVVMAYEKAKFEEGQYDETRFSTINQLLATELRSCQIYFIAVQADTPFKGSLSDMKMISTKNDLSGAPRFVQTSASAPAYHERPYFEDPYYEARYGDLVNTTITWKTCNADSERSTVYISEYDPNSGTYAPQTTRKVAAGVSYVIMSLQRGGDYEVIVHNDQTGGKNSTFHQFSPAPYAAPEFSLYYVAPTTNSSRDIYFNLSTSYYYPLIGWQDDFRNPSMRINIQYSVNGKKFIDGGNMQLYSSSASCGIPIVDEGITYAVKIRKVRLLRGKSYFGEFGTADLRTPAAPASASASSGAGNSRVGMYVGVGVSVSIVLVLSVVLGVWCVRHRRLQRSFLDFTSSHYNTRTDNATFNTDGDDDDAPLIQGFSDDEPLVIA